MVEGEVRADASSPRREARGRGESRATGIGDAVLDSGALDDLLRDGDRRRFLRIVEEQDMTLFIPAVVITEFLVGHPRDLPRAHRVLSTLKELDVAPAHARRAATLLMRAAADTGRSLGAVDGIVAAFGETFGMVITNDAADLRALADAGDGFDVYDVRELRAVLGSTSP